MPIQDLKEMSRNLTRSNGVAPQGAGLIGRLEIPMTAVEPNQQVPSHCWPLDVHPEHDLAPEQAHTGCASELLIGPVL